VGECGARSGAGRGGRGTRRAAEAEGRGYGRMRGAERYGAQRALGRGGPRDTENTGRGAVAGCGGRGAREAAEAGWRRQTEARGENVPTRPVDKIILRPIVGAGLAGRSHGCWCATTWRGHSPLLGCPRQGHLCRRYCYGTFVATAIECRDESRHGRQECPRHVRGWEEIPWGLNGLSGGRHAVSGQSEAAAEWRGWPRW